MFRARLAKLPPRAYVVLRLAVRTLRLIRSARIRFGGALEGYIEFGQLVENTPAVNSFLVNSILQNAAHRPWPLPDGAWIMAQSWRDLLFAHWPLPAALLRSHIPVPLEIDLFDGAAWIAVVPFRMSGVRLRLMPSLPGLSAFPELNVRTYVTCNGKPGVWFFSLDAASLTAVKVARAWFHLPYFHARMLLDEREGQIAYESRRRNSVSPPASLVCNYRPTAPPQVAARGSLEYFLTERYCLYAVDSRNRLYRSEVHHAPWPLQLAEASLAVNTMTTAAGISLPAAQPLFHFSRRQDVVVWGLQPVI
jgi:uncharacterized protein YqjF (DUF2071 family)